MSKAPTTLTKSGGLYISAFRYFHRIAERLADRFIDLRPKLISAGIGVNLIAYLSYAILMSIIGSIVGLLLFSFVGGLITVLLGLPPALGAVFGFLGLIAVGPIVFLYYVKLKPKLAAGSRKKDIDRRVHFYITLVSILASAGATPDRILKQAVEEKETLGAIADEQAMILRDIEVFGRDFLTALKNSAERSPSDKYATFLHGYVATITSGGNILDYLTSEAREAMRLRHIEMKGFIESLATMAEMFMSLFVVFPLLLFIMLGIMSLLGGGMDPVFMMRLIGYIMLPLFAVVFYLMLDSTMSAWM